MKTNMTNPLELKIEKILRNYSLFVQGQTGSNSKATAHALLKLVEEEREECVRRFEVEVDEKQKEQERKEFSFISFSPPTIYEFMYWLKEQRSKTKIEKR